MQSTGWVKWVLALGLLSGCMAKPKPLPPPPEPAPAGPQELARIRQELRRDDPNAEVGQVEAVMASNHLVAIRDVPVQDFPAGQAINIVNPNLKVIAHAVVDNVSGQYVVARYEVVARDPQDGDLAIRLSERRPPPSHEESGGAGLNDNNAAPAPSNPPSESKPVETPTNNPPPADNSNAAPQKSQATPASNDNIPSPAVGPGPEEKKVPTTATTQPSQQPQTPAHSPSEFNK